jgi:alkanesulfonate monooxygenase SsuD/methylene tetrahydromethanopterin reductase-like flavin-dependent oxidoreductase (luciferase family)
LKFYVLALPYGWESLDRPLPNGGRDTGIYQRVLEEVSKHAQVAEKHGFEGMLFSEQHGNIEGVHEITNDPVYKDLYIGLQTERLKVGQMGITLSVANPLLAAEHIAELDQMTKGRALAGFTRGNSARWVDQYGQKLGISATKSDNSAQDERNLRALAEAWQIVKLAWTQDSFSYDGEFWKFPVPGTKYPYAPSRDAGRDIDEDGNLLRVGIVPRPYQDPYPRVFAASAFRMATVKFWAREAATIVSYVGDNAIVDGKPFVELLLEVYAREAEGVGRATRRGEGLVVGGVYSIGNTDEEVRRRDEAYLEWYQTIYNTPPFNLPLGRHFSGKPEQIVEQILDLHERLGVEEFMINDYIGAPHGYEASLEMLELFGSEVVSKLSDTAAPSATSPTLAG